MSAGFGAAQPVIGFAGPAGDRSAIVALGISASLDTAEEPTGSTLAHGITVGGRVALLVGRMEFLFRDWLHIVR